MQAKVKNEQKDFQEEQPIPDEKDGPYSNPDEAPEEQYILDMTTRDEMGWPVSKETLSPKGMDQAEERAGLRDPK